MRTLSCSLDGKLANEKFWNVSIYFYSLDSYIFNSYNNYLPEKKSTELLGVVVGIVAEVVFMDVVVDVEVVVVEVVVVVVGQ